MKGLFRKKTKSNTQWSSDSKTPPDPSSYEDSNLHHRARRVISAHSGSADSPFDEVAVSLRDLNHEVTRTILDCQEVKLKSKKFSDLLRKYFENSFAISDFFEDVVFRLRQARGSQVALGVALSRFEEESSEFGSADEGSSGFNRFARMLQELERFRAAGDPFSYEFFAYCYSVHKLLLLSLRALQIELTAEAEVPVWSSKKWWNSSRRRGRREIVNDLQIESFMALNQLETIMMFVNHKFPILMKSLLQIVESFENLEENLEVDAAAMVVVVDEMKKKAGEFIQIIDDLSEHACFCIVTSRRRAMILKKIIDHGSAH